MEDDAVFTDVTLDDPPEAEDGPEWDLPALPQPVWDDEEGDFMVVPAYLGEVVA